VGLLAPNIPNLFLNAIRAEIIGWASRNRRSPPIFGPILIRYSSKNNALYAAITDSQTWRISRCFRISASGSAPTLITGLRPLANRCDGSEGSPSWLRSVFEAVKDPVSVVSGNLYRRHGPGPAWPMPLQVRRNYSSQNLANNQFGYGWKLNYMPFLSVSTNGDIIYAAEPDGAVIAYLRTGTNTVWLPTNTVNPRVSNRTTRVLVPPPMFQWPNSERGLG